MKKQRPKTFEDKIIEAVRGIKCPIHSKEPELIIDAERESATANCCCSFFKKDIEVVVGRVIRAWKLHGEHLKARRDERY
jgi:hypothetical protein